MTEIIWDGQGIPPQGTVCEFNANWAHKAGGESWHLVTVAYVSDELYVVRRNEPVPEGLVKELCGPASQLESNRFRRYRTPEQIALEERREHIATLVQHMCADGAFDVDDPEVATAAAKIYDSGYRKQVAP